MNLLQFRGRGGRETRCSSEDLGRRLERLDLRVKQLNSPDLRVYELIKRGLIDSIRYREPMCVGYCSRETCHLLPAVKP